MTFREILRDAPAGQLARNYLGWKIAPYADEVEGYVLPQPEKQAPVPHADSQRTADHDEASSNASDLKDKDLERDAANREEVEQQPLEESERAVQGGEDIARIATEKDAEIPPANPNMNEVGFSQDDRDNPQNWGRWKKAFVFAQICLLTFSSGSSPVHSMLLSLLTVFQSTVPPLS